MGGLHFVGFILVVAGGLAYAGNRAENWRVPKRAWDVGELWLHYGGLAGALLGLALLIFGCGAREPEPTDPVTVEVTVCEPTIGGTAGQYLRMSSWCREVALCAAMMPEVEDREAIREEAERYAEELDREFDDYYRAGRTGCYNGPVFREVTPFIEMARGRGLLCRGP